MLYINQNDKKKEATVLLLLFLAISILLVATNPSSSTMILYAQYAAATKNASTTAPDNFTITHTTPTTKGYIVNNIPGAVDPAICTPDLKRFVVHLFNETLNGKPILKILAPCVTVTGTVIGKSASRIPHIREDSDLIINLLPDSEFKSLASPANTRFSGAIHVEAICQGNNLNTTTGLVYNVPNIHVGDCKGFNGPHFPIPKVGDRLKITGVYARDIFEGGHTEIHPVYKIEAIGALAAHPADSIPTTTPLTHKSPKINNSYG